ncbi:hypothetical protein IWQ60_001767 [Tieghemiomyces parasiticus]|uniref:Uncharacterized protein n=1 Tax=Tieghemiomyces parasiticus TaxID=78921 RepID=A0A9W8ACI2_9FUNG|nr:hypothetical protein IWQ60_001767 [Tieghemiomyces parasiticus]
MIFQSPHPPVKVPSVDLYSFIVQRIRNQAYWNDPERPVYIDGDSGAKLTIRDFLHYTAEIAAGWQSIAGLVPGDVVAVLSPNDIYYGVASFSVLAAGGVVSPINPGYTQREIVYQLQASGARFIVSDGELLPIATDAAREAGISVKHVYRLQPATAPSPQSSSVAHQNLFDLCQGAPAARTAATAPIRHSGDESHHAPAYLCFSSGTTGKSKGVVTTHFNMVAIVTQVDAFLRGEDYAHTGQVLAGVLPFYHIYGLNVLVHLNLVQGCTIVVARKFDLPKFLCNIETYRIQFAYLVPPIVLNMARYSRLQDHDISSLNFIMSGAAPIPASLARDLETRHGITVRDAYGLTESSSILLMGRRDTQDPEAIGVLMPSVEARIVETGTGRPLGPNQTGELFVRGPNIMKGYLNNPEATEATFDSEGFLRTGDIGHVDRTGHFYITDRLKELIKYKGFQVAPAELEALLVCHPHVRDAAVIGVYNPQQATEVPRAYVVLTERNGRDGRTEREVTEDIVRFVASQVANHKKLRGGVEIVREIPKSTSGKIMRQVLRKRVAEVGASAQPSVVSKL